MIGISLGLEIFLDIQNNVYICEQNECICNYMSSRDSTLEELRDQKWIFFLYLIKQLVFGWGHTCIEGYGAI